MFELHERLTKDCIEIGSFDLSLLLLMNDRHYPWFILVPQVSGVKELYELTEQQQTQFMRESSVLGKALMQQFSGDKLNIGALGNLVPQLHVHHIVRYKGDAAWPGPIWGVIEPEPYSEDELNEMKDKVCQSLASLLN